MSTLSPINNSTVGTNYYRTNNTGSVAGCSNLNYYSSSIGFVYDQYDHTIGTISLNGSFMGSSFEAVISDYEIQNETISGSITLSSEASFVVRRETYVSRSYIEDFNQNTSTFIATSPDYMGSIASIDTRETITIGTTAIIEPSEPEYPSPPPVGNVDLNRFRKTYTHVRVKPRIRKYSTNSS